MRANRNRIKQWETSQFPKFPKNNSSSSKDGNGHTHRQNGNGNGHAHTGEESLPQGRPNIGDPSRQASPRLETLENRLEAALGEMDELRSTLDDVLEILSANKLAQPDRSPQDILVRRVREQVCRHLPVDTTLAVVSNADPALVKFHRRSAWHFPRVEERKHAGPNPACSTAAIAQLETFRAEGAQYLVFPSTSFWWLDHYAGFKHHLEQRYALLLRSEDVLIYSLREPTLRQCFADTISLQQLLEEFEARFNREPSVLDWHTHLVSADLVKRSTFFRPLQPGGLLPYLDHSVDIVIAPSEEGYSGSEARRVATAAVATAIPNGSGWRVEWLVPEPATPRFSCSIIIPCHNGRTLTEACLRSLFETLPSQFAGEVIVVDDYSSDGTTEMLEGWRRKDDRVKMIRNRCNEGYVRSCNAGASQAIGDILVFLNNDVVLLPGWLPPLLRTFCKHPRVGAVGAKLISPGGILQEAGGVVFEDGSAMNFGRGDTDLESPRYSFVREVDYCSGALLATERQLFQKLGGFDPVYCPGYYEDTDYCFRLRAQGFRVIYQPDSAVIHYEGRTAGTDPSCGMKQFQGVNREKFALRWRNVLEHQSPRPAKLDQSILNEMALAGAAKISEVKAL